jgi:acetyl-CoA/propionyl-CoA carboxylase, biotin carboxylase, biotin carboxyl carrier protein
VFKRVLVANRGEIALRVIRACRELGTGVVAVYSDADRDALHVRAADEAIFLGPTQPAQSYLNAARVLDAARRSACDAIHPGYGFLAENAAFARATAQAGLTFIGPSPAAMERMGDKLSARAVAVQARVPVVPGTNRATGSAQAVLDAAATLGYPIAIKASAGGGGKGLKVALSPAEVETAVSLASKEAAAYFADGTVYVERYLPSPKHVEVQVLGDRHGGAVHFGERDCSMQRRHQKLVEETPAAISERLRRRMHEAALSLVRAIGYDSAGTIECLVQDDEFYFLEMNARIQVEHTITEATYGFDLVKAQIRVAAGEPLWFAQGDLAPRGHAIECRVNAEAPLSGFVPSPGRIARYVEPGGPGIRIDGAAYAGATIGSDYDSLVAKLIAWGSDRDEARRRMLRALGEYVIEGIETTIPFYQSLLADPSFVNADYSTATVDAFVRERREALAVAYHNQRGDSDHARGPSTGQRPAELTVEVNDKQFRVRVFGLEGQGAGAPRARTFERARGVALGGASIEAPMHGIVAEIRVKPGEHVETGQVVAVVEAMKMMNEVIAQRAGTLQTVHVEAGQTVEAGTPLASFVEDVGGRAP